MATLVEKIFVGTVFATVVAASGAAVMSVSAINGISENRNQSVETVDKKAATLWKQNGYDIVERTGFEKSYFGVESSYVLKKNGKEYSGKADCKEKCTIQNVYKR